MMKKFEYRDEWVSSLQQVSTTMDVLGQEGWEAYYIYSPSIGFSNAVTVYMKREITK